MQERTSRSAVLAPLRGRVGRRHALAGLVLALAATGLLAICRSALGGPPAALAGRVVDAGGAGLADAAVYVFPSGEGSVVGETTTDSEGRFRVELAEAGTVDVRVGLAREVRGEEDRTRWHTLRAEALAVSPGAGPVQLVAHRDPQDGTVRVRVSTPEGHESRAEVRAVPTMWPPEAKRWWGARHTNAIGRVDLEDLPQVPVEISVARDPPWCPVRGPVVLPDPMGIDLVRIRVERERVLEGRVVDRLGRPVAACGVMVASKPDTNARGWGDITGLDGRFSVGVPESWGEATLLVGCEDPEDPSRHRRAVPIDTTGEEPLGIWLKGRVEAQAAPEAADASRQVMEAVLRAHYTGEGTACLVLDGALGGLGDLGDVDTFLEGVDASTVRDLQRKADVETALPAGIEVGLPTVVLAPAWWRYLTEVQGTMNRTLWRHFYRRFPRAGGLVILSPVGFSDDGRQAVLHVGNVRARLNAEGYFYLLEKRDETWRVVRRAMTWIS